MSDRWVPVGLAVGLLSLAGWWWTSTPTEQEPTAPAPVSDVMPQKKARQGTRVAVALEAEEGSNEPSVRPEPGAETAHMRRVAEWKDELFVSCFVGEEFSGLRGVEKGWFSTTTKDNKGTAELGDGWDTLFTVGWEAPEGVTEIECKLDAPRFGYVTVHVSDEQGDPLPGTAVLGCGSSYETNTAGTVELTLLVLGRRCDMEIMKHDEGVEHHAYLRVLPLQEDEARTYQVTAVAYDLEEGETLQFDFAGLHNNDDAPITGTLDLYDPELEQLSLEDYEERLDGMYPLETMLRDILSLTPEEERWHVEALLATNLEWQEDFREEIEALRAKDAKGAVGE